MNFKTKQFIVIGSTWHTGYEIGTSFRKPEGEKNTCSRLISADLISDRNVIKLTHNNQGIKTHKKDTFRRKRKEALHVHLKSHIYIYRGVFVICYLLQHRKKSEKSDYISYILLIQDMA